VGFGNKTSRIQGFIPLPINDRQMATAYIIYRWVLAQLGKAYDTKIVQIRERDKDMVLSTARSRNSKGQVRAEAADGLLALVYTNPTKKERRLFKNCVT
jgi:hypothetical protein